MHGIGYGDFEMSTDSFAWSRQMSRPSTDSSTGDRASGEIWRISGDTTHGQRAENQGERWNKEMADERGEPRQARDT
jgi:hypothetical protein